MQLALSGLSTALLFQMCDNGQLSRILSRVDPDDRDDVVQMINDVIMWVSLVLFVLGNFMVFVPAMRRRRATIELLSDDYPRRVRSDDDNDIEFGNPLESYDEEFPDIAANTSSNLDANESRRPPTVGDGFTYFTMASLK